MNSPSERQRRMLQTSTSVGSLIPLRRYHSIHFHCNPPRPDATPLEMLLTDSILDKIVEQTNLYASQYISNHDLPPRSRVHSWTKEPFTRDEFLSLIIVDCHGSGKPPYC